MQTKYLSALKTKYASFGLSKEALDRVALQRVKTIANEDEIDSDIASSETTMLVMKEMQRAADTLRSDNAKFKTELDSLKTNPNSDPSLATSAESPLAEELKAIKEMFAGLKADMEAGKKKAHADTILAQAHEALKKKGCTNDFIRNITLRGVEVEDSDTAESIAEKMKPMYDQNCRDAFGAGYVPPKGNGLTGDDLDFDAMVKGLEESGDL